jgi:hypothetical protein
VRRPLVQGVQTRNGVDTFAVPEWSITFEMPNKRRRILRRGAVLILVLAILGGEVLFLGERSEDGERRSFGGPSL